MVGMLWRKVWKEEMTVEEGGGRGWGEVLVDVEGGVEPRSSR